MRAAAAEDTITTIDLDREERPARPFSRPAARATMDRHRGCMACGSVDDNPASLGLEFAPIEDGGVASVFRATERHRSWDDRVHGGLIATLLDAAMTHALLARGIAAVTVELSVRYLALAPIGVDLAVSAVVAGTRHGVHTVTGRLVCGERLVARATARFMAL